MITVRTKCLKTKEVSDLILGFENMKAALIKSNASSLVLSNVGLVLSYLYTELGERAKKRKEVLIL